MYGTLYEAVICIWLSGIWTIIISWKLKVFYSMSQHSDEVCVYIYIVLCFTFWRMLKLKYPWIFTFSFFLEDLGPYTCLQGCTNCSLFQLFLMMFIWVKMLCGLVGKSYILEKHVVSIFRAEVMIIIRIVTIMKTLNLTSHLFSS
jgi:hypothetical protein